MPGKPRLEVQDSPEDARGSWDRAWTNADVDEQLANETPEETSRKMAIARRMIRRYPQPILDWLLDTMNAYFAAQENIRGTPEEWFEARLTPGVRKELHRLCMEDKARKEAQ